MTALSIGIDLGTSNISVALGETAYAEINNFSIRQLSNLENCCSKELLPTSMYIPTLEESHKKLDALGWLYNLDQQIIIGEFAKEQEFIKPDRCIKSAKSWFTNAHSDPFLEVLPYQSESVDNKISPYIAVKLYLEHIYKNLHHNSILSEREEIKTVITVPSCLNELTRTILYNMATDTGFENITLLEEPLAAFYSWISDAKSDWSNQILPGDIILVCDIGAGTTDFCLIAVNEENEKISLERISTGDHIVLGGDNMDEEIAKQIKEDLSRKGITLDDWQFQSLLYHSREAKEYLLTEGHRDEYRISIPSRSSDIFDKTITTVVTKKFIESVILDGFTSFTDISDFPKTFRGENSDLAIGRHLAKFLTDSLENIISNNELASRIKNIDNIKKKKAIFPTAILFNGGVSNASPIRKRIKEILQTWNDQNRIMELTGGNLSHSVSRGAASFGLQLLNNDIRKIKAGTSRSYYLGVEIPSISKSSTLPQLIGICLIPQNTQEDTLLELSDKKFAVLPNQTIELKLLSSATRGGDKFGDIVKSARRDLQEVALLKTKIEMLDSDINNKKPILTTISSVITKAGTVQFWLNSLETDRKWKLNILTKIIPKK